ncbi:unnamed protein product, partial [Prorocentrum cordatum]
MQEGGAQEGSAREGGAGEVEPQPPGPPPREAEWRPLCERPRLFHCRDFLTPEECEAVVLGARAAAPQSLGVEGQAKLRVDLRETSPAPPGRPDAAVLRSVSRRVAALTGEERRMSLGLHVDTNNCRDRRFVTFLIYLRTTPASHGGHTVFPLAVRPGRPEPRGRRAQRLLRAGEVLLAAGVQHTGSGANPNLGPEVLDATGLLLAHAEGLARRAAGLEGPVWEPCGVGLAVPPERGSCVAFFTRSDAVGGAVDPRSWHGGAAVAAGGKWTLQKFREAPAEKIRRCCIESFAAQHASLRPGC